MSVKNFNFLFKSMFLRKNGLGEKKVKLICSSSPRKISPPLLMRLPPELQQLFSPRLLTIKNRSPPV